MAHHLAVEVHIGFGDGGDVVELGGDGGHKGIQIGVPGRLLKGQKRDGNSRFLWLTTPDIPPSLAAFLMKPTLSLALAALLASANLNAQEAAVKPAEAPAAKPDMDKVSYFIGRQLGTNFKQQKIDVNVDTLSSAIKDVIAGKEGKYKQEELEAAMGEFEKYMQSRMAEIQAEMQKEAAAKSVEAKAAGAKFLADNGKREGVKTTASGLQYEVIKQGDGAKPIPTDQVSVHYQGTLLSGKEFDSSFKRGEPAKFGVQEVIKGWTEGLQLMSVGSKFKFFIPSDLAYGDNGAGGDIGPGETLVFEVELLKIEK